MVLGCVNLFGLVVIHFIFGLGGHMVWISLISDEELAYVLSGVNPNCWVR